MIAILKARRGALAAEVALAAGLILSSACIFSFSAHSGSAMGTVRGPLAIGGSAALDACSLISPRAISSVLGAPVIGRRTADDAGAAHCAWQVTSTFESVSLEIGAPNSAAEFTPGPGGRVSDLGGGAVEFDLAGRLGIVEVVKVSLSDDEATMVAAGLANQLIAERSG
ncbi:hypothetical protein Mycsm_04067 [Mycobacterium sp. JS623]|uniref:hypothetical protein n=1 Tax=Mycobacterium sp. JS623 TaxID=212767 RepID=UPI0002A562F0|nr:hypothetical protein [Mycobacterium sp. JS623]AGB24321.1 hypothetical protein Mycsm_04067 [Mycobacterium sp. JS623]